MAQEQKRNKDISPLFREISLQKKKRYKKGRKKRANSKLFFSMSFVSSIMSTNSTRTCAITNCDSLLGFALAYRFLSDLKHRKESGSEIQRVRVLYRRNIYHLGLDKLKELGAELVEVDYISVDGLKTALKGVHTVVLIPENSNNRLKEAKKLIKAAHQCNVEHMSMMSM
jgi:hypothetical protein